MPEQEKTPAVLSGEESEVHDEPHVEGTRVTVRHIHEKVEEAGLRPETVADRLGLSRAEVYNALAYYHENPGEMREAEELRSHRVAESSDEAITAEDLE